jgi:hypothetical protein
MMVLHWQTAKAAAALHSSRLHDFISCLSVIGCCCFCVRRRRKSEEEEEAIQDKETRVLLLLRHCLTLYE